MHVVAVCLTSRQTGQIERELISRSRTGHLCNNVGAGGERASAGSPHFVYLCTSSGLLRRSRAGVGEEEEEGGRGWAQLWTTLLGLAAATLTTITDANVELGHIVVSLHLVSGVSKGRRMKSIITDGDISGYLVVRRSVPRARTES